jgi:hypothetical protein
MYIGIVQNGIFGENYLLIQDDQEKLNSLNRIKITQQLKTSDQTKGVQDNA